MRFKIQVADRETGEESEIEVDAPTVQHARAQANDAGYLVGKITLVTPMAMAAPALSSRRAPEQKATASGSRSVVPIPGTVGTGGVAGGAVGGALLGAFAGYYLGGPLGIVVGAFSGMFAGAGIGGAVLPHADGQPTGMSVSSRLSLAGIMSGIGVAIFCGFCILPLSCWHGLVAPDGGEGAASGYKDRSRWTVEDKAASEKDALQEASQHLADVAGPNRRYGPAQLDRAKDYARREYEHNKSVMSDAEARRQYDKDLANIAQEVRDKGVR